MCTMAILYEYLLKKNTRVYVYVNVNSLLFVACYILYNGLTGRRTNLLNFFALCIKLHV